MDIWEEYYAALGRFVQVFASTESTLFFALVIVSGLDIRAGQAVLSGTRVRNAVSFIRRIYEVRHKSMPKRLDEALTQLSVINASRDLILHSGAHPSGDSLVVTNIMRAHARRSINAWQISPSMLHTMTDDLLTINARLEATMHHENHPGSGITYLGKTDDKEHLAGRPLLYKPPPQEPTGLAPPREAQARSRRPKASQE